MEIVNIIGLVTSVLSFTWAFVSLGTPSEHVITGCEDYLSTQVKLYVLDEVSSFAFGICGLLTDLMLVSDMTSNLPFTKITMPQL